MNKPEEAQRHKHEKILLRLGTSDTTFTISKKLLQYCSIKQALKVEKENNEIQLSSEFSSKTVINFFNFYASFKSAMEKHKVNNEECSLDFSKIRKQISHLSQKSLIKLIHFSLYLGSDFMRIEFTRKYKQQYGKNIENKRWQKRNEKLLPEIDSEIAYDMAVSGVNFKWGKLRKGIDQDSILDFLVSLREKSSHQKRPFDDRDEIRRQLALLRTSHIPCLMKYMRGLPLKYIVSDESYIENPQMADPALGYSLLPKFFKDFISFHYDVSCELLPVMHNGVGITPKTKYKTLIERIYNENISGSRKNKIASLTHKATMPLITAKTAKKVNMRYTNK
jgi:hypothetical protein